MRNVCLFADSLPKVQELAQKIAPQARKLELRDGMVTWDWGYKNLFLCEYYHVNRPKEISRIRRRSPCWSARSPTPTAGCESKPRTL